MHVPWATTTPIISSQPPGWPGVAAHGSRHMCGQGGSSGMRHYACGGATRPAQELDTLCCKASPHWLARSIAYFCEHVLMCLVVCLSTQSLTNPLCSLAPAFLALSCSLFFALSFVLYWLVAACRVLSPVFCPAPVVLCLLPAVLRVLPSRLQEALGALAAAIKSFDGGVLLISHNNEFTSTCCTETWRVAGGKVDISREAPPGPSN